MASRASRQLDGCCADSAASCVYQDGLPRAEFALQEDGVKSGEEGLRDGRCFNRVECVGNRKDFSLMNEDVGSHPSARHNSHHTITDFEAVDVGPGRCDPPGILQTRHGGLYAWWCRIEAASLEEISTI
jgi:hypothetical protein